MASISQSVIHQSCLSEVYDSVYMFDIAIGLASGIRFGLIQIQGKGFLVFDKNRVKETGVYNIV